jgi:cytochrome c oxidase subunit 1
LPVVYRWAYDFSVPGAKEDFIPQNVPPSEVPDAEVEKT